MNYQNSSTTKNLKPKSALGTCWWSNNKEKEEKEKRKKKRRRGEKREKERRRKSLEFKSNQDDTSTILFSICIFHPSTSLLPTLLLYWQ